MKKSLVFALIMVLAMAGIASAEVEFGGELTTEYVIDTNKEGPAGTGTASAPLKLIAQAEEEGVWNISAELKLGLTKDEDYVKAGKWSMSLIDDLFVADLWGNGVEKTEVKTPLEFVKAGKKAEDNSAKLRLTSDVAGYVDLTLDYDPDTVFLFAKKALNDVTVGGALKKSLVEEGVLVAGHVVYNVGAFTITGEAGIDTAKEEDNTLLGGKVAYELNDKLTLNGKVTHKAEKIKDNGELVIEGGAVYTDDLFKVAGTLTRTDDLVDAPKAEATYKVKGNVTYRSNEDVDYGDLFDDYDTLTGFAAFAEGAYTTAKDVAGDEEPLMEVTLKGAAVAVPGMVWAKGQFVYKSDEDGTAEDEDFDFIKSNSSLTEDVVLNAKDYYRLTAESTVQLTEKIKLKPAVKYAAWTGMTVKKYGNIPADDESKYSASADEMTELELVAAMTYALSDSSEVGLSYTDRTQKFDAAELKDGFAKVYFKTTF
jgi:hypothetical protein